MRSGVEEYIRKLIELSTIKKEYFSDIISGDIIEDNRIRRIILSLDEEFLACLEELKDAESIESIAELDTHEHPRLYDLKLLVEELFEMEDVITRKRNARKVIVK